jgi:hypothetical protein
MAKVTKIKISDTDRIAQLLQISPDAAVAYCEQVRAISRLGPKLQYKIINYYVSKYILLRPSPEQIAQWIRTEKSKIPSLRRKLKKEKHKTQTQPRRWNISKAIRKDRAYRLPEPKPSTSLPKDVVRTSYLDHQRLSHEKMERCPHNIPKIKVCAICDPGKFREMNGFD